MVPIGPVLCSWLNSIKSFMLLTTSAIYDKYNYSNDENNKEMLNIWRP